MYSGADARYIARGIRIKPLPPPVEHHEIERTCNLRTRFWGDQLVKMVAILCYTFSFAILLNFKLTFGFQTVSVRWAQRTFQSESLYRRNKQTPFVFRNIFAQACPQRCQVSSIPHRKYEKAGTGSRRQLQPLRGFLLCTCRRIRYLLNTVSERPRRPDKTRAVGKLTRKTPFVFLVIPGWE